MITQIVAYDEEMGIGIDNELPWRSKRDMEWFKTATMGQPVIMGRKTFDSIGRALPGRDNYVLSNGLPERDGCMMSSDLDTIITLARKRVENQVNKTIFIIGGSEIYKLSLPYTEQVYATEFKGTYGCNRFYPQLEMFEEIWCSDKVVDGVHTFHHRIYARRQDEDS